jgi:glycosyltransferase involved in cell wall biosynthesis
MKIAVFHNLPSGGAKRALYNYVDYLNKRGHKIDVYIPETANEEFLPLENVCDNLYVFPVQRTLKGSLYSFYFYPTSRKEINFEDLENTQKEIAETINSKEYDVVLCEQDHLTMAPFFLKYVDKPTAYYCQQPPRKEKILKKLNKLTEVKVNPFKKLIFDLVDKRAAKRDAKTDEDNASYAKYILANSYFSHESILKTYGLNSHVSYLGIDTEIFKPLNLEKENFVFSVGTCTPSKGYDFIIRSLSLLETEIRPKLVIVSNATDNIWANYLQKLANDNHVNIEILNLINDDMLVELYNRAKLVVFAPYLEPFGLIPIEAMACGTPVVAVKEGGMRETVIHNETGLLIERDELSFAAGIRELLMNKAKSDEMSKKSIDYVNNFWTVEHAGKRLEKHLNTMILEIVTNTNNYH